MPDRSKPPHIVTLVLAASVATLSMNIFLPSLPSMARYFQTDYAIMQLAVSLYLIATAVLQLLIGPASDRFGRRPVMLVSFVVFLIGTALSVVAPTVEALLACRVLQAFSAAGLVLSRAIVRDTVRAEEAASKIGYITMGMSLVPMIGPVIGGLLDEHYGWQSTFYLAFVVGLTCLVAVYLNLGETNRNRSSSFARQFASYPDLLRSRLFWGYATTAGFSTGAFFAFLGGGPFVASDILGLTPSEYGFYFGIVSGGYMAGNFVSGRFSRRIGVNPMMLIGSAIGSAGTLLSIALWHAGFHHPIGLFGLIFFTGVGNGMTLPNANAGVVSVKAQLAGSASGLAGSFQLSAGATLSVLASAMLGPGTGPYPLLWTMLASSVAAVGAAAFTIRAGRLERLE